MIKILIFSLGCLLVLVFPISCEENSELLLVQILYRHGDRAPVYLYPKDPNSESFWKEGLGMLTQLGKRQHYARGKYLKHMYGNFITSSPNEINVKSSQSDRCIMSAAANLASFYAPTSEWQFQEDLNWQPIPIWYIPKNEDKYLWTESYCPRATEEQARVFNSSQVRAFVAEHKEMLEELQTRSGTPFTDGLSVILFFDTLFIENKYNLIIPDWADKYWEKMEYMTDQLFFILYNSPVLHLLRAGPLLKQITEVMKKKIAGDLSAPKVQMYSAHDTTLSAFLIALNLFNMRRPPYAATILFELHKMVDSRFTIRLLYLNSTTPETGTETPHVLTLEGCTEYCPLEYFLNSTKGLISVDWEKECQLTSKEHKRGRGRHTRPVLRKEDLAKRELLLPLI